MTIDDIVKAAAVIVTASGGMAVLVIGLASWLGNLWASRILQREGAKLDTQLEALRHELGVTKSAYEHHLDQILDYYATFYRHYRLCQRTASADAHKKLPDGDTIDTKDEFLNALSDFLSEWAAQEGCIRLILPLDILSVHEEAIEKFNKFKRAVDEFSPENCSRQKKEEAFRDVEIVKSKLEVGLREFLRTESLLK